MFSIILFSTLFSIVFSQQPPPCPSGFRRSAVVPNKCFHIHTAKANYSNAQLYCQHAAEYDANLISIGSAFENRDVFGLNNEKLFNCSQFLM